jgi:CubicO group peptidase (beta-lactamase class C family)
MAEVHGTCDERFASVRDTFEGNLDSGLDVGASVAVVVEGEPVVDLWGGVIDDAGTPWQRDTIINVWSTTKTMTNLCALLLADRGEIDLHAPVARYWPEFKANGKEAVEVRHLLAHTAGLPAFEAQLTPEDFEDWDRCCTALAEQPLWFEPGSASGYHAITQGWLVGEVVRRVTGRSLGTYFKEELADPLGADFHIGLPPEHDARVAKVIPPPELLMPEDLDPESIAYRTLLATPMSAEASWTEGWRRAEIPAAGGHGNARSVARVQSVVSNRGEIDGRRYISEAGLDRIFEEQASGDDLVLGVPLRLGIGYGLNSDFLPISPNPRACFWGGWGGSIVVNDLDARMTVAYVMNRMGEGTTGDVRGAALVMAAYAGLLAG